MANCSRSNTSNSPEIVLGIDMLLAEAEILVGHLGVIHAALRAVPCTACCHGDGFGRYEDGLGDGRAHPVLNAREMDDFAASCAAPDGLHCLDILKTHQTA